MFQKIKQEVKQDYYQQNFSNDGQRFVAWYLRNVHLRDQNQTKYDVTDGKDDKQIDAVVIDDDNSMVYIIQGKFIGELKVDAEPLHEVLSSWLQLRDPVRLQEGANESLKCRLRDISEALEDDYAIVFELVTTATLTDGAKSELKIFQEQIAQDERLSATLNLVDNDELKRRYELALEREVHRQYHTPKFPGHHTNQVYKKMKCCLRRMPLTAQSFRTFSYCNIMKEYWSTKSDIFRIPGTPYQSGLL